MCAKWKHMGCLKPDFLVWSVKNLGYIRNSLNGDGEGSVYKYMGILQNIYKLGWNL